MAEQAVSQDARAMMLYEANKKSTFLAYAFWLVLGMLGAHRFYMAKPWSGTLMVLFLFFGLALAASGGAFLLALDAIFVVADAFSIPNWVREYNTHLVAKLAG